MSELRAVPTARNHTRRRQAIVVATVGSAVTLLASEALDPVGEGTAENLFSAAASQPAPMIISALLLLVSAVLLVPAVVGMVQRMPGRGARIGEAGATLLVLGAFGHAMAATFFLVVAAMPAGPLAVPETTALVEHLNNSPALAPAFVLIMSFGLGLLLAFIGLRRAGAIPTWVLGTIIGAFVLDLVAPGDIRAIGIVKQALVLIAFIHLARQPAVAATHVALSAEQPAPPTARRRR